MNIFVAKLHPGTGDQDLQDLFSSFGSVSSAKVIMDRDTGSSKRFGFVEMDDDEQAQVAIDSLNETEFQGNVIVVKQSEPKERRAPRGGGGGYRSGGGGGGYRSGGGGGGRDRGGRY